MTDSKKGFGDQNDLERAKLRGKGNAPDYEPGSDEGTRSAQEIGSRGDTTGLRGQKVGSQDTPINEYTNESGVSENSEPES